MTRQLLLALTLSLVALGAPASETVLEQAKGLAAKGKLAEAMELVERELSADRTNPRALFAKAFLLMRSGRMDEAEPLLLELTRQHPEFPEPFNNLAVLYAERGDLERAVDILKRALGTHSSYETAYENLTRVYGKLASRAYDRALGQESRDSGPGPALTLLGELEPTGDGERVEAGRLLVKAPIETRVAPRAPLEQPSTVAEEESAEVPSEEAMVEPERATAVADFDAAEIATVVRSWAAAWSEQRVDDYLAHYAAGYAPEGQSRREWEAQRRVRIARPDFIDVEVESVAVRPADGGRVQVRFFQTYRSDSYRDRVVKMLDLVRDGAEWKIVREEASEL